MQIYQKIKIKNNNGFTLMESLVVLSIVVIMIGILGLNNKTLYNEGAFERFYENFQNDIYFAQMWSISNKRKSSIELKSNEYIIKYGEMEKTYTYDTRLQVSSNFPNNTIYFNERGYINQAGTVTVCDKSDCHDIVFNLGNGRFYVKK